MVSSIAVLFSPYSCVLKSYGFHGSEKAKEKKQKKSTQRTEPIMQCATEDVRPVAGGWLAEATWWGDGGLSSVVNLQVLWLNWGEGRGLKGHNRQPQEGVVIGIFKRIKIYLRFDIGPPKKAKWKAEQVSFILLLLEAVIQSNPDHIYSLKRGFGFGYLYENIVVVGRDYIRLYIK